MFAKSVFGQVEQPAIGVGWWRGRRFVFHDAIEVLCIVLFTRLMTRGGMVVGT